MSIEDMFDTMANAKPFASRLATVKGPGKHKLALDKYYLKNTQSNGTIIAADLVVVDSTIHAVGTEVSVAWFLNSGKHQWMRDKEAAKAQQFVKAIAATQSTLTEGLAPLIYHVSADAFYEDLYHIYQYMIELQSEKPRNLIGRSVYLSSSFAELHKPLKWTSKYFPSFYIRRKDE
jgi:hypothetical protein